MTLTFALNRTCAPQLTLAEFIALAQTVGVQAVEMSYARKLVTV